MVTIPTIHPNGSSKADLLAKLRTAISLIDKAIDAIRQTAPNGRDYYPQRDCTDPFMLTKANTAHSI